MRTVDDAALSRHLVRLDPGDDLVPTLEALASALGWSQAFVTGAGVLELVELLAPTGQQETFANAELVALSGTIKSGPAGHAAALRGTMTCEGTLVSGRIIAAVAAEVLLLIDAVTADAEQDKAANGQATEARQQAGASTPSEPPAPPPTGPSPHEPEPDAVELATADAAEQAVATAADEPPLSAPKPPSRTFRSRPIPRRIAGVRRVVEEEEALPDPGDYLDHPQLGLCQVEGTDDAGGTVIVVPSGRRRTLRLEALRVLPPEVDEQGRRVLKVAGPRRRH